jgi:alginate O-acetyltransferase complex protein AlgI
VLCYSFQIFYDFSGYTDMAIGLAKMFGFRFPENFDQPYTAANVTDFWRRWHMTLTRFFRDYVYIPLGGNRAGALRTYVNLFAVFFLCGLWHGAAWTFVAWGMYHGILLVIERIMKQRAHFQPQGFVGVAVTFVLVAFGWVFFRSDSIADAFHFMGAMLGIGAHGLPATPYLSDILTASTAFYLVVAAVLGFLPAGFGQRFADGARFALAKGGFAIVALLLSIAYVSETTFRPFIYFRF